MIAVDALAEAASIILGEENAMQGETVSAPTEQEVVKRKRGRPRKSESAVTMGREKENLRSSARKKIQQSFANVIRLPSRKPDLPNLPECPVCGAQIWGDDEAVNEHIDGCVKPTEESAEWSMCGVERVRAVDLVEPGALPPPVAIKEEPDDINIDQVEDEKYGPAQYTVAKLNRIAQRASKLSRPSSATPFSTRPMVFRRPPRTLDLLRLMQQRIRQQEQQLAAMPRCNICLSSPHQNPVVSTQCWHVYCEACWAQAFQHKRVCPQCSTITLPSNLRRIYL